MVLHRSQDISNFRDLSRTMGNQTPKRASYFLQRYKSWEVRTARCEESRVHPLMSCMGHNLTRIRLGRRQHFIMARTTRQP